MLDQLKESIDRQRLEIKGIYHKLNELLQEYYKLENDTQRENNSREAHDLEREVILKEKELDTSLKIWITGKNIQITDTFFQDLEYVYKYGRRNFQRTLLGVLSAHIEDQVKRMELKKEKNMSQEINKDELVEYLSIRYLWQEMESKGEKHNGYMTGCTWGLKSILDPIMNDYWKKELEQYKWRFKTYHKLDWPLTDDQIKEIRGI